MKHVRLAVSFVLGLFLIFSFSAKAEAQKTYTVAVVPQFQVSVIYEMWTPFLKKLSQELGVELKIIPFAKIQKFEDDLSTGVPDFAYMNPYEAATIANDAQGYVPLVKDKTNLVGIIVVRKGGAINTIKDLSGKEIAFPSPNAFAASLYMRALLIENEKINFTPVYVKTHSNVYATVAAKRAAGGGGVKKTLMKEPEEIKNELTTIYETPGSASHPLSAHPRVPQAFQKRVVEAVLKLASDPANKDLFKNIQMPEPVTADYRKDYLPLKKLNLKKYMGDE